MNLSIRFRYFGYTVVGIAILFSVARTDWVDTLRVNLYAHSVVDVGFSTPDINLQHTDLTPQMPNTEQGVRWSIFDAVLRQDYSRAVVDLQKYMDIADDEQKTRILYWITQQSQQLAGQGDEKHALSVLAVSKSWLDFQQYNLNLGTIYSLLGDLSRAIEFYEQSITLQATPEALLNLAKVYTVLAKQSTADDYHLAQKYYETASMHIVEAIHLDASFQPEGDLLLGDVYWKMNRRTDSVEAYLRVTEDRDNSISAAFAWYYLGNIYAYWWADAVDYRLARSYFERAYAVAPDAQFRLIVLSAIADVDSRLDQEKE